MNAEELWEVEKMYTEVWLVVALIWGIVWGAVTRQTIIDKGYDNGAAYFFLGFFLGLIGWIYAFSKPDLKKQVQEKMMYDYIQGNNQSKQPSMNNNTSENNNSGISSGKAKEELTAYKNMLDEGLITEEEYEAKKKQILNI